MRLSTSPRTYRASMILTELTRNIPTFVFLFYLAFVLPGEFGIPFTNLVVGFPSWLKASLALSIAVVGFCSDNLSPAISAWRKGNKGAALLFMPSWTSYALIIVMASSTASVIGVSELVSRCNTVINATGSTRIMLPVYLYACVFFIGFCYPLNRLMKHLRVVIDRRLHAVSALRPHNHGSVARS
jgi:polar amino acid transport system permease protein